MRPALGIRGQLIAGIAVTTLAGIGLIGVISVKMMESNAVYLKARQAGGIVKFVRSVVRTSANDPAQAVKSVSLAFKDLNIADYELKDSAGRALLKSGQIAEARGDYLEGENDVRIKRIGGKILSGPGTHLLVSAPLGWGSGRGGEIRFLYSIEDVTGEMRSARRFIIAYAIVDSVIIIAFGIIFLSGAVIKPIQSLKSAAERISGGNFDERVIIDAKGADNSHNEVISLSRSFNTMAERLSVEIKTLERTNRELLATQEELLRSRTLAAVGSLAAGIAHEIGNPLGAVKGYLDVLKKGRVPEEDREFVDRAIKEAMRIDAIVREFLQIARPTKAASSMVDVNSVLEDAVSTISVSSAFAGIKTELNLDRDAPKVMIDEGKLRQVFLNLLINAAHSMKESSAKGITINTGMEKKTSEAAKRRRDDAPAAGQKRPLEEREYVFISFADTGCGMGAEEMKKVFDPFFSTKEPGAGTGLGLFMSQGIIKAYGGEIRLASSEGEGSKFTVLLPAGRPA